MNLAMLNAGITNCWLKSQQMLLTVGLTVEEVLSENESVMESGGELGEVSTKITGITFSAYHMIFGVCIALAIIAFMIGGGALLFSNSNQRQEIKNGLVWKFVGVGFIVGAVTIVLFAESIATGLAG